MNRKLPSFALYVFAAILVAASPFEASASSESASIDIDFSAPVTIELSVELSPEFSIQRLSKYLEDSGFSLALAVNSVVSDNKSASEEATLTATKHGSFTDNDFNEVSRAVSSLLEGSPHAPRWTFRQRQSGS